eukprot:c16340_g1_i1.p1 GENE.c16340_g1_i1~~c16340_g1_i1.p1  ORF type:complete len:386 (-),score=64.25 c16340_g1_i1:30-1079(-)
MSVSSFFASQELRALLQMAGVCKQLRTAVQQVMGTVGLWLHLDETFFTDSDSQGQMRLKFPYVTLTPYIQRLQFVRCKALTDSTILSTVFSCPALTSLVFTHVEHINDDTIEQILVRFGAQIQLLSINCCDKISSATLLSIANHCSGGKLGVLGLAHLDCVSDNSLEPILVHCGKSLECLNLTKSRVTDRTFEMIVLHCPRLNGLHLAEVPTFTVSGLIQLMSEKGTSFFTLNILQCPQLTVSIIPAMRRYCPHLRTRSDDLEVFVNTLMANYLYRVKGRDNDQAATYVVLVHPHEVSSFLWASNEQILHLSNHGEIVASNFGTQLEACELKNLLNRFDLDEDVIQGLQ